MTSVLKKSKGTKGKSESMQEDLPLKWGGFSRNQTAEDVGKFIKFIDDSVIGKGNSFCGPFGRRKVVYCDYSGSGRALQWLEDYVAREVLPTHATRCTALSYTSGQTDVYRCETKSIIRNSVGADADDVVVLGASLTRFLRVLRPQKVVVFVSSRETQRNLAPWKECDSEACFKTVTDLRFSHLLDSSLHSKYRCPAHTNDCICKCERDFKESSGGRVEETTERKRIIKIPESKDGFIDLNNLEFRLQEYTGSGKKMIGFFAAASKLTGVLADDVATTLLLHQYGALAFWDYTLLAPYAAVDMNPMFPGVEEEMVKKDAVFFNCEKFVGGIQGPFVTVVKKDVFRNNSLYTDNVEKMCERIEEWRCSEAVRAAMVMQLRDSVGLKNIADRQDKITKQVISHMKNIPELILLGSESTSCRRLPIFSLMVKHPRGTFLHHNFICAVLNDVFGIQARGGLDSNLIYGQDVLGIDDQLFKEYEKLLDVEAQKELAKIRKKSCVKAPDTPIHNEHLRPGFCRVSLPYFMSESELAFVLEALKMVATEGWKILPQYVVNPQTGQWRHHSCSVLKERKSLHSFKFNDGKMVSHDRRCSGPGIFPQTYTECLQTARNLFNRARKLALKCSSAQPEVTFNPRIDYMRWFMLPQEAHDLLLGKSANVKHIVPFDPSGFTGARKSLISRSKISASPVFGSSARHYSLPSIEDSQTFRLKQKFLRETSLKESHIEEPETPKKNPVKFAIGESVSPVRLSPLFNPSKPLLVRSRCYSLGSNSPPAQLSSQTKLNLGLKESSPNSIMEDTGFCNCGSQTDLPSLEDGMIAGNAFLYSTQSSASISDCSQNGRVSPTASINSQHSEELQYIKDMTKEIATEIKSEIREVITKVDNILENSDNFEQSNLSLLSSQSERNSVSVIDVAEYLMGMSKEMASEVKHEIREMVNQVDEMISPDYTGSGSRRSSPPYGMRRRLGSGPELGLNLQKTPKNLRKCPTSPILCSELDKDPFGTSSPKNSPILLSPKSTQRSPNHETSGHSSISFNSSETSTPDTIIQVVTTQNSPSSSKSSSSNKLSDDETCSDLSCRHCCSKKNWCQNPSVSSQDSGINLTYGDPELYSDFVKWRTSSDPTNNKSKRILRLCHKHEKTEVPDIIEGVPVCPNDLAAYYSKKYAENDGRVVFKIPNEPVKRSGVTESKRSSRSSNASSSCSDRSSRSSGYMTDVSRPSREESEYDRSEQSCPVFRRECCWEEDHDDSSACSDNSITDFTFDDEGQWHCPPKSVWKSVVEAIQEYNMIRPGDKVLVCLSGGRESIALLHTLHQYQFYSRSKGIHFSIGALFVHEPKSEVDPLHLMAYCRTLGVKLIYQDKMDEEPSRRHSNSNKAIELPRWATHAVRRRAYCAASAHGYGVAAIAQHLDHAARAFLAGALHGGALHTIKAHYRVREHDLRIIRPFIYVRERDLDSFATGRMLPDFRGNSKMAAMNVEPSTSPEHSDESGSEVSKDTETTYRARSISETSDNTDKATSVNDPFACATEILTYQEQAHAHLFTSLKSALHPLISAKNIEKDLKEHRHRKKSVIQMKNGAPVYDSDEGTEEEPVP